MRLPRGVKHMAHGPKQAHQINLAQSFWKVWKFEKDINWIFLMKVNAIPSLFIWVHTVLVRVADLTQTQS